MTTPAVRTRFAPSPTGFIHVGSIRTALFAWLVARQANGAFVLRFEDTDKKREIVGSRKHLIESLKKLSLNYDEGPDVGGPFTPYTQSERLAIYKTWALKLIDNGRAYADPYTSEEVQKFRDQAQKEKKPFLYRNRRPENPPAWDGTTPLRFKSEPKSYNWHDAVMGDLASGPEVIDDFILIKSDGYPTYNFAHIVDDTEMEISHVIRGQEFIASQPNYLNLYEALQITPPIMATVPFIMGSDGRKKLSKRDGAKDVLDYIRQGFLPEALLNFIASLGWNDSTEQEIYSKSELIKRFSLDHVQKSGAKFDEQRLLWMNGCYIRNLSLDELYGRTQNYWPASAKTYDETYKKRVLELVQERLKFLAELPGLTNFFFEDLPLDINLITCHKQLKKIDVDELVNLLKMTIQELKDGDFSVQDLTNRLNALLIIGHAVPPVLFSLVRIATTRAPASPGLAETLSVLGKATASRRLEDMINFLSGQL